MNILIFRESKIFFELWWSTPTENILLGAVESSIGLAAYVVLLRSSTYASLKKKTNITVLIHNQFNLIY